MKYLTILLSISLLAANITSTANLTLKDGVTVTITGDYTHGANAALNLEAGTLLNISGNLIDNGGSFSGDGIIYVNGSSWQWPCIDLHEGHNLISFSVLPDLHEMPECIESISNDSNSALNVDGNWYGSLMELSCEDGYWVTNTCGDLQLCSDGMECYDPLYTLHEGISLISYPFPECGAIGDVIPEDVQNCLAGIIGEGIAASNLGGPTWVGSLSELCPNKGYWFVNECDDIEFTFIEPPSLVRQRVQTPSPHPYNQSSKQAFYFFENIDNIKEGDFVLAYNGETVIGAREWTGEIIDVPAMGDDGSEFTAGYIQTGSIPTFKLLSGDKLTNLEGDIPAWTNNELYMVENLSGEMALPETYSLDRAYPNPFNPSTNIKFGLPENINVSLEVYDISGRLIKELQSGHMDAGYHSIVWNAENSASGMYFIKLHAGSFLETQKIMLIK